MANREKVIKGLECCTQHGSMCGRDCNGHWGWTDGSHTGMELLGEYRTKCPYGNCETGCVKTLTKDAIALLKEYDEALKLMVYQYCTMAHVVFHNQYMSAGEAAFRLLGLENGQSTDGVWERWFPND